MHHVYYFPADNGISLTTSSKSIKRLMDDRFCLEWFKYETDEQCNQFEKGAVEYYWVFLTADRAE